MAIWLNLVVKSFNLMDSVATRCSNFYLGLSKYRIQLWLYSYDVKALAMLTRLLQDRQIVIDSIYIFTCLSRDKTNVQTYDLNFI